MNSVAPIVAPVPERAHRDVPFADVLLIMAVVTTGVAAASVGNLLLWGATPVVAAMLMLVAHRAPPRDLTADGEMMDLPADVRGTVRRTLAQLPDGIALRMLHDVIRPARAVLGARASAFGARDDADIRAHVVELLGDACEIAIDLARIDASAPLVTSPAGEVEWRFQVARTLFERRLGDASLSLASLYASGVERGTPASDRVARLVTILRDEAAVRSEAKAEIEALLVPPPGGASPS